MAEKLSAQKPAVILARVSDISQTDGYSPDAQLANSHAYAERKNLKVEQVYSITESSTKKDRPEFERMLAHIGKQKHRTALIVDCVDRLNRSFTHHPVLFSLMERDLLEIHFVREGYSIDKDSNSMQKLMFNMGTVMAQSYVDQLKDNIKRSINHKIETGLWIAKAPIGYRHQYDPEDVRSRGLRKKADRKERRRSKIVVDEARAPIVVRMFKEYALGHTSLRELHRKSAAWGLRNDRGNTFALQTVCDIIANPFYYGVMKVKGKLYPHNHPTLIDRRLYQECQKITARLENKPWKAAKETRQKFLLRGMVNCAVSGKKVTCDLKKGKYVYLVVGDPDYPGQKLWVKEETVLKQIAKVVQSITIPESHLPHILDYVRKNHEAEKTFHRERIKAAQLEMNDLEGKLNRLTDLLIEGHVTEDTYKRKHLELDLKRQNLSVDINRANGGDSDFKMAICGILALLSKSPKIFESSNLAEKRTLLGLVFSNLELKGTTLRFSLRKPLDQFVDMPNCLAWCAQLDIIRTNSEDAVIALYNLFPKETRDWVERLILDNDVKVKKAA